MGTTKLSRSAIGPKTEQSQVPGVLGRIFGGSVTVQATGRFLRRNLWLLPIVMAAVLGLAGWWVNRQVEEALRVDRVEDLTALLDADVVAINAWISDQKSTVELLATDERILELTAELLVTEKKDRDRSRALRDASAQP